MFSCEKKIHVLKYSSLNVTTTPLIHLVYADIWIC